MKYNKISGFSDEIDADIKAQFEALVRLNIEYFEARGVGGKNISALTEEEAYALLGEMNKNNIKVSSIGSPIGKIDICDNFEPHFETFKNVCKIAKILGTKYIRIFSFYSATGWDDDKKAEVYKRLGSLLNYAKENNLVLLHENEKDIYGETTDRCFELICLSCSKN